jgi:integrase
MRHQREQRGHIFEAFDAFHVRYWLAYNDLPADEKEKIARKAELKNKPLPTRVQKSRKLCEVDKQHKDVTSKSVRDLAQKVMDEVNGLKPGEPILPDLTLVDYWEKHYEEWAKTNLKPSTFYGYKQVFHQHLKTHFGKTRLKDITTPMVTKMLGQLAEDGQGERTISHTKWVASGIFKHAMATGFASHNPWPTAQCLVKTPRPSQTEVYSVTEALGILAGLDRVDTKLAFAFACFVGMRKGEIQGLKWEALVGDGVRIERAMSRNQEQDSTKTGKARMGLLIEPVKSLLQEWREMNGNPTMGWLFPNAAHHPMSLDSMAQRYIIPKLNNGLRWKGWQAGRRGCSTILTELTGDALAARDILGHSTTKVTEQHYIAAIPEAGRKGMMKLEERLKSLSTTTRK